MPKTIFYAWQSDLANGTNRTLIRKAIERALDLINASVGVEDALRPDQDTQGVPGNPSVADTIFDKIDRCAIFVPDISIVTPTGIKRRTPNPNVLIEYGRATKSLGDARIVPVFNSAYGSWEKDRPFDMRHKRMPVVYELSAEHTSDMRRTAREMLTGQLVRAFSTALESGLLDDPGASLPDLTSFGFAREDYLELRPSFGDTRLL